MTAVRGCEGSWQIVVFEGLWLHEMSVGDRISDSRGGGNISILTKPERSASSLKGSADLLKAQKSEQDYISQSQFIVGIIDRSLAAYSTYK